MFRVGRVIFDAPRVVALNPIYWVLMETHVTVSTMRSIAPIYYALAFLPFSDWAAAWVAAGSAGVGLALVGCLAVIFGRPGAKARLGV